MRGPRHDPPRRARQGAGAAAVVADGRPRPRVGARRRRRPRSGRVHAGHDVAVRGQVRSTTSTRRAASTSSRSSTATPAPRASSRSKPDSNPPSARTCSREVVLMQRDPRPRPPAGSPDDRHPARDASARHLDARRAGAARQVGERAAPHRPWSPAPGAGGRWPDAVRPRDRTRSSAPRKTSSRRLYRDGWMPMLAEGDDARLLWYMNHAHGSGPVVQRRDDHRRARRRGVGTPGRSASAAGDLREWMHVRSTPPGTT